MAFVSLKAWRARSAERAEIAARLKRDLVAALNLGETDTIAVNEIACPDPGCPDLETVVLVMRAGAPTRALRIRRPMEAVGPGDIDALIAEDRDASLHASSR
ncbi:MULTISPECIES: hypothetical protein [unclassified Methylobacterium]|jgi:hypothetical protein|uniref:hypothetical protein n=1 Tax=unclassified Methylobacterium TaxID=2615210 RepID=UPI001355345B|nr:hypothetical protein [Methylobacterium sp. 2A]MWV22944.1 hypothetical protein [Methylobacterium sp. 2A]